MGLEPTTSSSTVKRSAIELRPPYWIGRGLAYASKPSSVLDGHLSRWDVALRYPTGYFVTSVAALVFRPARRATSHAWLPMRRGRFGDCCREDCPFHSAVLSHGGMVSVALALRGERRCGLSGPTTGPSHAFTWHPALCSSDFPLSCDSDHPAPPILPNPLSPM